ncbi:hypothetical protein ACIPV3_25080 [Streptomyces albidoflavus]
MTAVEYLAEVYGGDARRTIFLGGTVAPTRRLVLRWLRGQALRLAAGLDPPPGSAWVHPGVLRPMPAATHDAPSALRVWASSPEHHDEAAQRLAESGLFELDIRDGADWYRLTARPMHIPCSVHAVTAPPQHFARPSR